MRKFLGIVVLSFLFIGNASSYTAFGIFKCGELISRKNNEVVKKQVTNYAQGYFTGRNAGTNDNVGKDVVTSDGLFWSVVNYCEENPLKDGADALYDIFEKLKK
ncbi:hypothetical protein OAQ13_00505 [Candidatus Pelagibacter sp.]|nr:hypothetical protein [Candidatus Pelagibacter sp.]